MVDTEKRPFVANAVFIPDSARREDHNGEHVESDECTLLMVDGDNNSADVYTEEAWNNDGQPICRREWGEFTEVEGGKVELLPEIWVVKIDEREYWCDPDVLANCPRIYGVYVFDRNKHIHICSTEASYELTFLGSDYTEVEAIADDDYRRDEINSKILNGDAQCEEFSYWGKYDIERMLQNEIKEGHLPPEGQHGGYRLTGFTAVTTEEAIEEARELHNGSPL